MPADRLARGAQPAAQVSPADLSRRLGPPLLHGCLRKGHPFLPRAAPGWMRSRRVMRIAMLTHDWPESQKSRSGLTKGVLF
jgi:hypothetical protein